MRPMSRAGAQVELLLHFRGNPLGMLDRLAVHVGDPQRAVGPGGQHRGPEPVVGRGQKLAAASSSARRLVNVSPSRRMTSRCTRLCTGSLTKALPSKAGPEQVVAIDDRAAGRREAVGRVQVVEAGERAAARKDFGGAGLFRNVDRGRWRPARAGCGADSRRRARTGTSGCCCCSRTSCPSRRGCGRYCVVPDCGSSSPSSGRMRKSRPLAFTVAAGSAAARSCRRRVAMAQYIQLSRPHFSPLTRCC